MKKCQKCSTTTKDEDKFCIRCGQKFTFKNIPPIEVEVGNSNKSYQIVVVIAIIIAVLIVFKAIKLTSNSSDTLESNVPNFLDKKTDTTPTNPVIDKNPNIKVSATKINVDKFYNGEYIYSISIPSGNRSTCIWNWTGGSGAIPDSTTTYANTSTEKHTITYYADNYDYIVNCFDDFSNQYVGSFPTE